MLDLALLAQEFVTDVRYRVDWNYVAAPAHLLFLVIAAGIAVWFAKASEPGDQ
jgi:hypothetical protein